MTASGRALALKVPAGWNVPSPHKFEFARPGEREQFTFDVTIPSLDTKDYHIEAVASSGGREYREGYTTIRYRDLETRYLYSEAVASVRGVDVSRAWS